MSCNDIDVNAVNERTSKARDSFERTCFNQMLDNRARANNPMFQNSIEILDSDKDSWKFRIRASYGVKVQKPTVIRHL